MKNALITFIAFIFLAAFVALWAWIAYELTVFEATEAEPVLDLDDKLVDAAGFFAATVGAGTAAFLGLEVQKRPNSMSLGSWFSEKTGRALLLATGVLAYLGIGIVVSYVWLTVPEPTPEFIATFAWGAIGWAAGAFVAAFAGKEP